MANIRDDINVIRINNKTFNYAIDDNVKLNFGNIYIREFNDTAVSNRYTSIKKILEFFVEINTMLSEVHLTILINIREESRRYSCFYNLDIVNNLENESKSPINYSCYKCIVELDDNCNITENCEIAIKVEDGWNVI